MDSEVSKVAKLIADHIGHGMREKFEPLAGEIIAALARPSAADEDLELMIAWWWDRLPHLPPDGRHYVEELLRSIGRENRDAALTGAQP